VRAFVAYDTFDSEEVLAACGEVAVVCQLVAIVRADLETHAAAISGAASLHHLARVRESAHAIGRAVANVSSTTAQALADDIESRVRAGDSTAVADVPRLVLECHKLRAELGLWLVSLGCAQPPAH
jgi:hypothetical protein